MAAQTRANGTGKRWSLLLGVVSLFLLTALGTAAPALADDPSGHTAAPWIASDQPDYAPGSNVVLTGGAWEVGETVRINVNDDRGASWERAVDVTADANGNITDSFRLPDWFIASYTVKARGSARSRRSASQRLHQRASRPGGRSRSGPARRTRSSSSTRRTRASSALPATSRGRGTSRPCTSRRG